jgi:hypothetical protein
MLLDRKHLPWLLPSAAVAGAALALHAALDRRTPGGLTGGSTAGLWFGIAGSALMLFAGLLSLRRQAPSWWWLGSRQFWLRGHIWLGLLSVVLILCHSGFRWGGPLERLLLVVFGLTIVTGVVGLVLQHVLPRMLAHRVASEAPYEQIPHLCRLMRQKADEQMKTVWAIDLEVSQANLMHSQLGTGAKAQLQHFYEKHVRVFLTDGPRGSRLLANPLQAEGAFARLRALPGLAGVQGQLRQLETFCDERRQFAQQERLHHWLHAWLLLHVPLSVLLLFLGVAHAVTALYY